MLKCERPRSYEPLDMLADAAGFADARRSEGVISWTGKKLSDYIEGKRYMSYHWRNMDSSKAFADVEIVNFEDPLNYSGANMYLIKEQRLDEAIRNNSTIDLTKEAPTHGGEEVVKILKQYAEE